MQIPRCRCAIYRRDVPRYTGRGRGGYEMHYTKRQCSRKATNEAGTLCTQHAKQYAAPLLLDWHLWWTPPGICQ